VSSESEKISFNNKTGHRILHLKVDADTDEEAAPPARVCGRAAAAWSATISR